MSEMQSQVPQLVLIEGYAHNSSKHLADFEIPRETHESASQTGSKLQGGKKYAGLTYSDIGARFLRHYHVVYLHSSYKETFFSPLPLKPRQE